MPRDISGNYALPASNPVVSGTTIEDDWANDTLDDIVDQLNNVVTQDGVLSTLVEFGLIDGLVTKPGLFFKNDIDTGIRLVSAGTMSAVVAGVDQVLITDELLTLNPDEVKVVNDLLVQGTTTLEGTASFEDVVAFTVTPVCSVAPTVASELANKAYVDSYVYSVALPNPSGAFGKVLRTPGSEPPSWDDAWGAPVALSGATTLEVRKTYHVDTSGGTFTADLPAAPTAGDWVALRDIALALSTENLVLDPGAEKVYDVVQNYVMDVNGEAIMLVFDSTKGWVRG